MTDSVIILSIIALPCVVFLLWCLTPWGRRGALPRGAGDGLRLIT